MREDLEKHLIRALEAEPSGYQENDLSEGIIRKIQKREKSEQQKIAILYVVVIGVFLLLSAGGLIYFLGLERIREMKDILLIGLLIGGIVLLIQWLDYKLIKSKKSLVAGMP